MKVEPFPCDSADATPGWHLRGTRWLFCLSASTLDAEQTDVAQIVDCFLRAFAPKNNRKEFPVNISKVLDSTGWHIRRGRITTRDTHRRIANALRGTNRRAIGRNAVPQASRQDVLTINGPAQATWFPSKYQVNHLTDHPSQITRRMGNGE